MRRWHSSVPVSRPQRRLDLVMLNTQGALFFSCYEGMQQQGGAHRWVSCYCHPFPPHTKAAAAKDLSRSDRALRRPEAHLREACSDIMVSLYTCLTVSDSRTALVNWAYVVASFAFLASVSDEPCRLRSLFIAGLLDLCPDLYVLRCACDLSKCLMIDFLCVHLR